MLRKIGRSSSFARSSASGPHGYQSTGLLACWSRYGLVSWARRLGMVLLRDPCCVIRDWARLATISIPRSFTDHATRITQQSFMLLAIALGGAVGSVLRFLVGTLMQRASEGFPYG